MAGSPASTGIVTGVKVGGTSSRSGSPTVIGRVSSLLSRPSVASKLTDAGPR